MKKLNKKLQLNKETIAQLTTSEMNSINGGEMITPSSGLCYEIAETLLTVALGYFVGKAVNDLKPQPIGKSETYNMAVETQGSQQSCQRDEETICMISAVYVCG